MKTRLQCISGCEHVFYESQLEELQNDGDITAVCPNCNQTRIFNLYTVSPLDYNHIKPGEKPHDKTSFRIQASGIAKFFSQTSNWYRDKLLGLDEGFNGNTSSVLGTCLHWAAENWTKQYWTQEVKDEMYAYIELESTRDPEIDAATIKQQLTPMWKVLRQFIDNDPGGLVEPKVEIEIMPGITVGGSIDRIKPIGDNTIYTDIEQLRGKVVEIQDWKTTGNKTPPTTMTKDYQWQLLVYAWVLKEKYDITVTTISDVFITRNEVGRISPTTNRPMKDYPSTIGVVSEPVTAESLEFIKSLIMVVAHSVHRFVTTPQDRFLLAQDFRLFGNTQQLPFTKIGTTIKEQVDDI